jgi:hypothetical protein
VYNYYSEQYIDLRGYRYSKNERFYTFVVSQMNIEILNVYSTIRSDAQHHLLYSHVKDLHIKIPINMRMLDTPSSGQLFKNVDHLIVEMDSAAMLTFWESILDLCM